MQWKQPSSPAPKNEGRGCFIKREGNANDIVFKIAILLMERTMLTSWGSYEKLSTPTAPQKLTKLAWFHHGQISWTQTLCFNGCCSLLWFWNWLITVTILLTWLHLTIICSLTWRKCLAACQYHVDYDIVFIVGDFTSANQALQHQWKKYWWLWEGVNVEK